MATLTYETHEQMQTQGGVTDPLRLLAGYPLPKPLTPTGGEGVVLNDLPAFRPRVAEPVLAGAPPVVLVPPVLPRGDCGCGCASGGSACGAGRPTLPSMPPAAGGPAAAPATAGAVNQAGMIAAMKGWPWWIWLGLAGLGLAAVSE